VSDGVSFGPHVGGENGEWSTLGRLVTSDPDRVWTRLLEVAASTDDASLYWVGDIIEDLISAHGWAITERLEAELAFGGRTVGAAALANAAFPVIGRRGWREGRNPGPEFGTEACGGRIRAW
jgi:hypothetical protein